MNKFFEKLCKQFINLYEYKDLLFCWVINDLKIKYRRSVLGYFWSLLHPLMMMAVMAIAFTNILKVRSEEYVLYLLCSLLPWNFLVESIEGSACSIIYAENLIKTQNLPKILFPIRQVMFSMLTFVFSLTGLLMIYFLYKFEFPTKVYYLFFSIPLICVFSAGIGVLVSVLTVYLRDVQYLLSVFFKAWFYVTPILYPLEILPENYQRYLLFNPATHFVQLFTEPIYKGMSPGMATYSIAFVLTFCSWFLGLFILIKYEKKLIYRL